MADISRRRVSYNQLEQLWEFLNKNKPIATGFNKTSQAREFSKRMWMDIAQNLNSHGDGANKDWKGWCKYWTDYKSKLKNKAAATRASHQQTGGGPSVIKEMTEIEKKFLHILGEDFGTGLPGMRVEPFEPDIQEIETGLETPLNIVTSDLTTIDSERCSESILTLYPGQDNMEPSPSIQARDLPPPPASPPPPPASPPPPPASPPTLRHTTARRELQSTPRRSPRRRRHTRREPPITQDAARRALIQISERRALIEERNSETLRKILEEMKEIKELLQLRSVGHPTGGE